MDLIDSVHISASGLGAQSARLKVVSQNIANADSVGTRDGKDPYRRQTITFKQQLDRETGIMKVTPDRISTDKAEFDKRYEPSNPQADANGFVLYPNINPALEMVDMREARRGYEANLNVIQASKTMYSETVDLLK